MKERPIPFKGPMVSAILEDRKTMTRRVIKPQPIFRQDHYDWIAPRASIFNAQSGKSLAETLCRFSPYKPGDLLWVREGWKFIGVDMNRHGRTHSMEDVVVEYRDGTRRAIEVDWQIGEDYLARGPSRWRPSIHMPRWASRLLLEVKTVRVERVKDMINAEEIEVLAEGIEPSLSPNPESRREIAISRFRELWDSINLARGYGWDANPWVWVIEFARIEAGSR